jgi:anti-sigma regulatory factor (Ser/Thr protein kinase)
MTFTRRFPGVPQAAHDARDFTRLALACHPAADIAELCVTELFANAIAYTSSGRPGGAVTVAIRIAGDGAAVVTVLDEGSPEAPLLPVPAGGLAEHGRGLVLVDALTDGWGTAPDPGGRSVWFCCAWERP